ncbi:IQ and ubiquitin-like domain-containing protein isoform X2 [Rhinatrema bivittatum]|uniref:IQ and ubiquitin-like domain-containing protein isoform X2 n=1 Tax=Rhinatrema bivittatum TaxID=194408 RepID=UPI001126EC59|nr:IQ and ubiquitin-like domain-containing protein isoform X2 [Rhinatrema bivittatum]
MESDNYQEESTERKEKETTEEIGLSETEEDTENKHVDIAESPLLIEEEAEVSQPLDQEPNVEDQEATHLEQDQPSITQEPNVEKEHPSTDQEPETEQEDQLSSDTVEKEQLGIDQEWDEQNVNQDVPLMEEDANSDQKTFIDDQEPIEWEQEYVNTDQELIDEKQTVGEQTHPYAAQEPTLGEQEHPSTDQELIEGMQEHRVVSHKAGIKMMQESADVSGRPEIPRKTVTTHVTSSATATVKIMLVPDGHVITMAFAISNTAGHLKEHFASQLKIPLTVIQIIFQGAGKYQDVVVEIERLTYSKPYLGGYRHKVTGVEFHNAGTQTKPKRRPDKGIEVFSRDAQTVIEKNRKQQCANTTSTQMTKIGCYVSNLTDKLIEPGKYVTADEYHARRLKAVIIIQTYFRRFLAKRIVEQLRLKKRQRLEWELKEELRKKKEKEDRLRSEYERRMHPRTKEDFELLFHALELWRLEELDRINRTFTGAERKAALCALLEQEAQFIASIGRHKHDADEGNQQLAVQFFLSKCSEPKKWKAYDGRTTAMYTQYTIRAQYLQDIYNSLNIKYLALDERLDVLLTLKHTMKEYDCKLTQEIIELIDREADLMMRGVKECNLEGLRKRISTLFLQYIKTPFFNPEVARILKVPQDPAVLRKDIFYCHSCKNYLPATSFSVAANAVNIGRCCNCSKLDNEARRREDFSKYKYLLSHLQKSEADFMDDARIAFLLQEKDVQYLVESIWAAQSALSAWNDLYDLVWVRWDKYIEWSPWNCILLTKDEADAHLKLSNPEEGYEVVFIHKIKFRHTLAKNYFKQIPEMLPYLYEDFSDGISQRTGRSRTKSGFTKSTS